jgi:hypothetical protein
MRNILKSCLVILILASPVLAQTTQTPQTQSSNIENLLDQTGKLSVKDFKSLIRLRGFYTLTIDAISVSFPASQQLPVGGVRLTAGKDARGGFIDSDEILGFVAALDYLSQVAASPVPADYREVRYSSRGGVEITLFPGTKGWTLALQVSRYSGSTDYFDDVLKAIAGMKDAFGKAIPWLTSQGVK